MKGKRFISVLLSLVIIFSFIPHIYASEKGSNENHYVKSISSAPVANNENNFGLFAPSNSMKAFNESFASDVTYYTGLEYGGSLSQFGFKIELDTESVTDLSDMWYRITTDSDIASAGTISDKQISSATFYTTISNVNGLLSYEKETDVYVYIGKKYDSDESGSVNYLDKFDEEETDIYVFGITKKPNLTGLTIKDGDGNTTSTTPAFNQYNYTRDYQFSVTTETIKIDFKSNFTNGIYVEIGGKKYTSNTFDLELNLSDYTDSDTLDVVIPVKVVYSNAETSFLSEELYTFKMAGPSPVIVEQPQSMECDKDAVITLAVGIQEKEGDTISYQWLKDGNEIEGATNNTYNPATEKAGSSKYSCRVTNTIDGKDYSSVSNDAIVTVRLTYVSSPGIIYQPGTITSVNGSMVKDYNDTYSYGNAFDAWIGMEWPLEDGTTIGDIKLFYNDVQETEGAIEIPITWALRSEGNTLGEYAGYYQCLTQTLPEGEWYVYAVVTAVAVDDDDIPAGSTISDFWKLTYTGYEIPLEGSGTEIDPFQLKTEEDFIIIRDAVNNLGISFDGACFKMMNDITLSDNWSMIGAGIGTGEDGDCNAFSGSLNGDNHTLSYAQGSEPLFKYVLKATIKNLKLYGKELSSTALIEGDTFIQGVTAATIDNVTLVSGTSTKLSGLVDHNLRADNRYYISNCIAEEGVTIGYTKDQSAIGSFAGYVVGTFENCVSHANVYGTVNVGGIVANQSNSMGQLIIKSCLFDGVVVGVKNVGGVVGQGYSRFDAPNALCMVIENCDVSGEISGEINVGGILGCEDVDQAWDNGIGIVKNNNFTGTISGETNVGAIAGVYRHLNRYTVIENNYYSHDCGAKSGFGFVAHVDTNAIEFGMHDGVMYYSTENLDYPALPANAWKAKYTEEQWEEINYVVEVEPGWRDMGRWVDSSITKADHNRTDDPLGADAEKLCYTDKITDIEVTETPTKTEYVLGEELDLTGLVVSANWYPEATTEIDPEDLEISGFDSSVEGEQEITVTYGDFTTTFKITVTHVEYEFLEGANGTWTADSDEGLKFRVDMPFAKFTTVDVDGETLDSSKYEASEGSTVVVLDKDYLNGLTAGSHTIRVNANDGYAETSFTIKPAGGSAATGESIDPGLWIMMTVAVAIGVASMPVIRRRRRSRA